MYLLQTIVPIIMNSGGGGGDFDYLVGFYVASNLLFIVTYFVRFVIYKIYKIQDASIIGYVFWDKNDNYISPSMISIIFLSLNGLTLLFCLATYITEHFIK